MEALEHRIAPASLLLQAAGPGLDPLDAEGGQHVLAPTGLPSNTPEVPGVPVPQSNPPQAGTVLAFVDSAFVDNALPTPFASGILRSFVVDRDPTAGVALDFYYQLVNDSRGPDDFGDADFYRMETSGGFDATRDPRLEDIIVEQTNSLAGLTAGDSGINFASYSQGAGLEEASSADRDVSRPGGIGFDFPPHPAFTGDASNVNFGESSTFLIIRTLATSFAPVQMVVAGSGTSFASSFAPLAPASTFTVNTTLDVVDPGDGVLSLREAIIAANGSAGRDTIDFNIPGVGTQKIATTSPLPAITEGVIIDGYTQPGTSPNTAGIGTNAVLKVVIDASGQGNGHVLILGGTGGSTVMGLVIQGAPSGINDNGYGISIRSDNNTITGNFIGTDVSGFENKGNRSAGVGVGLFLGTDNFTGNRIGGTDPADRNILSGSAFGIVLTDDSFGTVIQGNLIGTTRTGADGIPNINAGIANGGFGTFIGGGAPGAGNVISSNDGWGINTGGTNTTIQGNFIGVTADGTVALGNGRSGVNFSNGARDALVGGSNAGEGNVISGNLDVGIEVGSGFGDGPGDNITIRGNYIGTDKAGALPLGNLGGGIGVFWTSAATIGGTLAGDGNLIAFNGRAGIFVNEVAGPIVGARFQGNVIHSNTGLGIDLVGGNEDPAGVTANDPLDADAGPNGLQNYPTILSAKRAVGANGNVTGTIHSTANSTLILDFYNNPADASEGRVFLGSATVTTDGSGNAPFDFTPGIALAPRSFVTATATDGGGNTSEFSAARAVVSAQVFTWDAGGGADTSWFTAENWSPDGVPGPDDTAILDIDATISLDGLDATVANFTQNDGTLFGSAALTITGAFAFGKGTQGGSGSTTVNAGGTFSFNDIGAADAKIIDTRALALLGSGSVTGNDDLTLNNSALFIVSGSFTTGSQFDIVHTVGEDGQVFVNTSGSWVNADFTDIGPGVFFDAQGPITFPNTFGALNIMGGGLFSGGTIALTGNLTHLRLQSDFTFQTNTTFTGSGALHTAGGTTTIPGGVTLTGTAGTTYALDDGILTGSGTLTSDGRLEWNNGGLFDVTATFNGAASFIAGSVSNTIDNATLNFGGGVVDTSVGIVLFNGATINIGAAYEIRSGHDFEAGIRVIVGPGGAAAPSGGAVNILAGGSLTKNVSADVNVFGAGVMLVNNGTVSANSGNFDIQGESSGTGGTWTAILGNKILFNTGTHTFGGTTTFSEGAGGESVILSGATMNLNGPTNLTNAVVLRLSGGTLNTAGVLTVGGNATLALARGTVGGTGSISVNGTLDWTEGTLSPSGGTTVNAVGNASFGPSAAGTKTLTRDFNNKGTGIVTGPLALIGGASFLNSGTLDFQADTLWVRTGGPALLNSGTLLKSGGAGDSSFGGALAVANSGTVEVRTGRFDFQVGYTQTAGTTFLNGGSLGGGTMMNFQDGILTGAGAIAGAVNNSGATIQPGGTGTIGDLAITGRYTQDGGAALEIELGGTGAGQFDRVTVSDFATLGGALTITTLGGFTPPAGSVLAFLPHNGSAGNFAPASIPPGTTLAYQANAVVINGPVPASPFVVTTTLDVVDGADGVVSLREAITSANGNAGLDTITFNIPGGGVKTIAPTSALPTITGAVVIDGYSQPGASANTLVAGENAVILIELDGTAFSNSANVNGLRLVAGASGSTIRGLAIYGFPVNGILLNDSDNNVISGNFIGTDATGLVDRGNRNSGIESQANSNSDGNTIGGTTPAARNLISGNKDGGIHFDSRGINTTVQGNFIGLAADGSALGNSGVGVVFGASTSGTLIGGDDAADGSIDGVVGARNFISGNSSYGVYLGGASFGGATIRGNYIGTDVTGTFARANGNVGIFANQADGAIIGGATAGAGNLVSANGGAGITLVFSSGVVVKGNRLGTQADGVSALGNNGEGIQFNSGPTSATVGGIAPGEGNVIAFNRFDGVSAFTGAITAAIRGNSIFSNGTTAQHLGIDLDADGVNANDLGDGDAGPNGVQNFPVLTSATRFGGISNVSGTLNSTALANFFIDFYASSAADPSGFGEGSIFLGDIGVTTDAGGNVSFNFSPAAPLAPGTVITATATAQSGGSTSEFGAARRVSATFVWDAGAIADTSWFNPLNWDLDSGVPADGDTAILNIGATIDLPTTTSVGAFQQSAGIFTSAAGVNFTVLNSLAWSGGTMSGAGTTTVNAGATATLSGGPLTLDGRALISGTTVTQTGATALTLANGASIASNATWLLDGDGDLLASGAGPNVFTIGSGAVFRKTTGAGVSDIGVMLNHTDGGPSATDLAVQAGTLRLLGGGAWDGTDPNVSAGALLEIAGGTLSTANRQSYVDGAGTVRLSGGTLNLAEQFSTDAAVTLEFTGGTLAGSDDLVAFGPAAWSGGDVIMANTSSGLQFYGATTVSGAANRTLHGTFFGYGTTTHTATGAIDLVDDSGYYNYGTMDLADTGDFTHSGALSGAFFASVGDGTTDGILRKTDGSTTSFGAGVEFSASGLFELNAGTIATTDLAYLLGITKLQGGALTAAAGIDLSSSAGAGREGILTGSGTISGKPGQLRHGAARRHRRGGDDRGHGKLHAGRGRDAFDRAWRDGRGAVRRAERKR